MSWHRFSYSEIDPSLGAASAMPYLPINLVCAKDEVATSAPVDSGAALNVLPYHLGLELGARWERQTVPVQISGNLAASEARALLLTASFADFEPVRLAFAWTRNNDVPVILGQVNFFMEFDVSFFRSDLFFEIRTREAAGANR